MKEECPMCYGEIDKPSWEKENWRHAKGIKSSRGETNSALAQRDYSVTCNFPDRNKIAVIKGYWIWWCSSHHQPHAWCALGKAMLEIAKLNKIQDIINENPLNTQ